jgi:broad specificity phosphatase PhoE
VYSTPYNRTRQTILPLATEKKVAVTEYAANKPYAQFVKEVLDANRGKTVVVVGHSNTVPEILKILSNAAFSANISESQFDNLFIVTVPNEGNPSVLPLKYGKTTP